MRKGVTWNAESHVKLLMAILAQTNAANLKLNYDEIVRYMGPECTPVAVRLQLQKLRRKVCASGGGIQEEKGADAATPTTPKRKGGTGAGKGVSKKAKKGVKSDPTVDKAEDGADEGEKEDEE
ncbi:hypothetical protein PHISCL_01042 [Aspergillus sclerotialis]|uniref:Uncharacterized protein n=1 Tax=Aspergillus sclerotialis TaxID=2070753 RepID=A0A3A2ZTY2_9EURO|nr:hypothetical protein PHISCL_01042 [Aspergillus sclerotialis]